jgi:hypothetical protein
MELLLQLKAQVDALREQVSDINTCIEGLKDGEDLTAAHGNCPDGRVVRCTSRHPHHDEHRPGHCRDAGLPVP